VKCPFPVLVWLCASLPALAQDEAVSWDTVIQSAQDWAAENLDTNALRVLAGTDQERTQKLLNDLQAQFQGEYILDLAPMKEVANSLMPVLEAHEETKPYARWLKARLDYLEFAQELRLIIPSPGPEPGAAPSPLPNPPPEKEREIWVRKVADRELPEEARGYIERLKPIFAQEKAPPELVWLAEVESGFDPNARSPGGAVGLYQLMPATARQYGLRTWILDQRLNAETNACVAAKHLAYLHRKFKDWRLALAAYNAGEGTVENLLKRQETRSFDAIAPRLPAETQMYVPRVEAIILRREGVKLDGLP
jgi:membrane-bound lytic murein transglycosylase D